jgi:hypothetical protein
MVAALVHGKRKTIENLDDLVDVVTSSWQAREPLILIGNHDERYEFHPATELTDKQNREALLATRGSWKGLVDGEKLKRDIYASRGQTGRDWFIAEEGDTSK